LPENVLEYVEQFTVNLSPKQDTMNNKETILAKAHDYVKFEKDAFFKKQVDALIKKGDEEGLNDRFYTDLEFGTGGLRGVIGGGYNSMNPYTVRKATQGVASYVVKAVGRNQGTAVIAYDSRNFSDVFAMEAARVFAGNGIKTYLFTSLRPTPELSFALRRLGASVGIVVTASHNPAEYNGYKVYWSDGAQVVPPHDKGIIAEVRSVTDIHAMDKDEALERGLITMIDREIDDPFIDMIKRQVMRKELLKSRGAELTVVYTPLHGTGAMPVSRALSEVGVEVIFVEEQREPNGDFPTVTFPNPEEADALKMALSLGTMVKADLIMATDPDADRIGIAVPSDDGWVLVTGNQLGALLADYILSTRAELGTLPKKPAIIKTIVTTELQRRIADTYGAVCIDTLTGFKYIGEKIREFETTPDSPTYVFGGEESYGYLVETDARDKDAVSAAVVTAEMALYHQSQGHTLLEQLNRIYEQYGYFKELLVSKYFKGESGLKVMNNLMATFRSTPPAKLGDESVVIIKDYKDGTVLTLANNKREKSINLPPSNVLQFVMSAGTVVTVRPSGTEPKIKFYASCCGKAGAPLAASRAEVEARAAKLSEAIKALLPE
jgi:phosphoglucomutase